MSVNKISESAKYYNKSLLIYEHLCENNPQQFEPDLAAIAMNLGIYHSDVGNIMEAEKYYLKSLNIREHLTKNNPQQFEPKLARTAMNLGLFYFQNNIMSKSEDYYLKSLEIYERYSKSNPEQFESDLAGILNNYGWFNVHNKHYDKAQNLLLRALALQQQAIRQEQTYVIEEYDLVFYNLKCLCDSLASENNMVKVVEIQIQRAKSKCLLKDFLENGKENAAEQYNLLAWCQLFIKNFSDAEQSALQGLSLNSKEIGIKTNLAHALLFQNKDTYAQKVYSELKTQQNTEGVLYRNILKDDFDTLEQAGLDKTQLDKARQWIKD